MLLTLWWYKVTYWRLLAKKVFKTVWQLLGILIVAWLLKSTYWSNDRLQATQKVCNPLICMSVIRRHRRKNPVRSSAETLENSCKSGKWLCWKAKQGQKLIRHSRVSFCYTAHVFFLCFRRMKISLFWLITTMCFLLLLEPRILFRSCTKHWTHRNV